MPQYIEQDVARALLDALNEVPKTHAELRMRIASIDPRVDLMIEASIGGQKRLLMVEMKQTAFPRDVREMLYRLLQLGDSYDGRRILPMVIANSLSAGARQEIREAGAGYFDLSGSLYLPADPAFVFIDRPPRKAQAKKLATVFHGRKAAVVRVLFSRRDEWISVKEISDAAAVSPATASETLTELERREWVEAQGAGPTKQRRLTSELATVVLDAWTQDVVSRPPSRWRRYFVPAEAQQMVVMIGEAARDAGARYAITGEAAAQTYTPHLTSLSLVRCRMTLDAHGAEVLNRLGARAVGEGWNLAIHDSRNPSDFSDSRQIDGVCYASPLQVYLDLLHAPGRAKDLGQFLRRDLLRA
ncbi:hypothetical protein [Phenylobacterium sp.]|uniref:hypothetical protein n=1 Tax=Phenylobacterium sp. TaxID=1871053 RepID=UPI0035B365F3